MITCSVFYCLINELIKHNIIKRKSQKLLIKSIFVLFMTILSFSRIYISAHFPDQCLFGLMSGIIVALIIDRMVDVKKLKLKHHFFVSFLMISTSYIIYELLNLLKKESADWSVKLAQKYCFDINQVKADTTPLYVIWRTSGNMIGIGIAFYLIRDLIDDNFTRIRSPSNASLIVKVVNTLLSLLLLNLYVHYSRPDPTFNSRLYEFYVKSFIQFLIIPIFGLFSVLTIHKIINK
jgi:hypothetical protein